MSCRPSVVEYAFCRRTEFARASDAVRGVCCGVLSGVPCAKAPASPRSLPPLSASPLSLPPSIPPSIVVLHNRKMDAGTEKKLKRQWPSIYILYKTHHIENVCEQRPGKMDAAALPPSLPPSLIPPPSLPPSSANSRCNRFSPEPLVTSPAPVNCTTTSPPVPPPPPPPARPSPATGQCLDAGDVSRDGTNSPSSALLCMCACVREGVRGFAGSMRVW
jgi:hypothetical protein